MRRRLHEGISYEHSTWRNRVVDQKDALDAPPGPEPTEPHGFESSTAEGRTATWLAQLQTMIDNLATAAGPPLREVAAKAAELAAKAGDAAGPIAQKAASVTGDVGQRVAAKSRDLAADLRRPPEGNGQAAGSETKTTPDAVMPDPTAESESPPV
jgi:hypothetical protein